MGLTIRGISKAKRITCDGNSEEDPDDCCEHDRATDFPFGRDGLRNGCYVPDLGGSCREFSLRYSEYSQWLQTLFVAQYGVGIEEVCKIHRRFNGQPFLELVNVANSSGGAAIGPKLSAKLLADFRASCRKIQKFFLEDLETAWMWDVYKDYRAVLRLASNNGFVSYW